ncbi:MAG: alpha-amylase family glycosyl hydrolase [Inhella sp.]
MNPRPCLIALALLTGCAQTPQQPAPPRAVDLSAVAPQPRPSGLATDWHQGAFMEIFVRAYQDSDGDGVGDLRGLTSRLDYLKELGVTGLWLMPVTASADHDHGYATTDFRAIERDYGTLDDFDELLRQAHARGIGVIIDYVVNHSSHEHPLFQAARADPQSPHRDWFVWSEEAPQGWDIWGKNPWYWAAAKPWEWQGELKDLPKPPPDAKGHYFGTFGPHMPDFNLKKAEVFNWHLSNLRFWLNRGLDGFRLDAVPHLVENNAKDWNDQPESRRLTKRLFDAISAYPSRYTVCEATAEPQAYSRPEVCGSAFAFGLERAILQAVQGKTEAVGEIARFFQTRPHRMATMLANHDIFAGARIWDQLQGDEARYKLAAASYLLQPGIPFIYYGEEIGLGGVTQLPGDGPIRGPMSWDGSANAGFTRAAAPFRPTAPNAATQNAAAQRADPNSLFHHYRGLLALRQQQRALRSGSYEGVQVEGPVLSYLRRSGGETLLVALNYSAQPQSLNRPERDARAVRVWPEAAPSLPAGVLPAWGAQVWLLEPGE